MSAPWAAPEPKRRAVTLFTTPMLPTPRLCSTFQATQNDPMAFSPSHQPEESRFPLDLERDIFELAAISRPVIIPDLMLVAHRVRSWYDSIPSLQNMSHPYIRRVEPLLYRTIFMSRLKPMDGILPFTLGVVLRLINERPGDFLFRNVRHLYLGQSIRADALNTILAACTNVGDLFLHFQLAPDIKVLAGITCLRRLTVEIDGLFRCVPVDFTHPLFRNITHLEILDSARDRGAFVWAGVISIANLTHLAFWDPAFCPILDPVLRCFEQLQCVVFLCKDKEGVTQSLMEDPRFVVSGEVDLSVDWQAGAVNGNDYWARAEKIIAKRRAAIPQRVM